VVALPVTLYANAFSTRFEKPSSAAFCKSLIPWLRFSWSKRSIKQDVC
jgi:hypothetical protein